MEGVHGTYKASRLVSEDVVSSMPDNVMTNIMNRMPIRDVVRTSILAKKWRLKWTLLTQLIFDSEISRSLVTLGAEGKKYYNSRVISRLLLVIKGPVTKFVLYIRNDQILDAGDLNYWVLFLSGKGVKEFTLINLHHMPLRLPIHLFSCLELTHLKLGNCLFHPSPIFCGFPNLLSLDLRDVHFQIGKFGEFITLCPLLEVMQIDARCCLYALSKINMDDIAKLKNLKKLSLPLRELEEEVFIIASDIFQFLGFLPKLEKLHLDFSLWHVAVIRDWVPTVFACFNTLKLSGVDFASGRMLSCVCGMIWGSPNLQELKIIRNHHATGADELDVLLTALFSSDLGSNTGRQLQLQGVVIKHFSGSKNEVCLIKYLLACSPFLKRIAVYSTPSLASVEKLRATTALLKLNRASPVA